MVFLLQSILTRFHVKVKQFFLCLQSFGTEAYNEAYLNDSGKSQNV